ncbi:hypothetical protein SAMN04488134_11559 [Amphibacillus marinus]|uniref:Alpha/beta hydrolase n=1 Tax=Amphibacillus marinus TaxID=872970 RepID=A0A1H8TB19_9BACI|nr:alpha/beta hydrolase-fold protein [Amphibacillus marinus]SEO88290.1 hypothetical protein SAMN04488134_11559 [Amphibacillus marinus]
MNRYQEEQFIIDGPHHKFQINVATPNLPAPEQGFAVLYILDGNAYFTLIKELVRLQNFRPEKTGIDQMILVGIGYPDTDIFNDNRMYDFTPPAETVKLIERTDGLSWPEHSGADHFLDFIEQTLKPKIEATYPVDQTNQALFGHSLGGLFTLYALFTRSHLFQQFIAFSPSIWWNEQHVLTKEAELMNGQVKRLFIAAENSEQKFMYDDAHALYQRLVQREQLNHVEFFSLDDENHMSIVPTGLSRALRFVEVGLTK